MTETLQDKHKKFISVIVYFRSNIKELVYFLNTIESLLSVRFENYEIIIVNNQAETALKSALKNHFKEGFNGDLSIINFSWRHNIEDAMRAGIDLSIGDLVFEFDTVLVDYEPKIIMDAYDACISGHEMVSAVATTGKKTGSKYFYKILKVFSDDLDLTTETFRLVSRKMINMASSTKEVFSYRKANYHYTGLKTRIMEYVPSGSTGAQKISSLTSRISLAGNILIYYSSIGTRISLFLSLIFLVMSILVGVYVIVAFLVYKNNIQEGWSSIMLFLSLSFCGLFGILALISKYVEVLLKETKSLRPYTYRTIEKLDRNS